MGYATKLSRLQRTLLMFVILVVWIAGCSSSSSPSSGNNIDPKYIGSYYARCPAASGVGYQECAMKLESSGRITGYYDNYPSFSGTYTIDGNQLKVDTTGDGAYDESIPISGNKITNEGIDYVKK